MKYCNLTTIEHPISVLYPNILEDINDLIVNEGYAGAIPAFPNAEIVINMDAAEENVAANEARAITRSMDMALGISNADNTSRKMLLVEFKLRVGPSLSSVNSVEFNEKIVGLRSVLGNTVEIHGQYIFIFQSNIIQLAKSTFFRWNPRLDGINKAMDIAELQSTYFLN